MRTMRLKQLIDEALKSLPKPHTEEVIEDVFHAIERNPAWRKTYDALVYELGKPVVNNWGGFWVAHAEGRVGGEEGQASRATLINSYARLSGAAAKRGKKVKEPDALKAMHDHFLAHRETLPASIRDHRALIVALIMDGIPTEAAFSRALEKPAFAR